MRRQQSRKNRVKEATEWMGRDLGTVFLVALAAILGTTGIFFTGWSVGLVVEEDVVPWALLSALYLVPLLLYGLARLGLIERPIRRVMSGFASAGGVGLVIFVLILSFASGGEYGEVPVGPTAVMWFCFAFGMMTVSEVNVGPLRSFTYTAGILSLFTPCLYLLDNPEAVGVEPILVYLAFALFFGLSLDFYTTSSD